MRLWRWDKVVMHHCRFFMQETGCGRWVRGKSLASVLGERNSGFITTHAEAIVMPRPKFS